MSVWPICAKRPPNKCIIKALFNKKKKVIFIFKIKHLLLSCYYLHFRMNHNW